MLFYFGRKAVQLAHSKIEETETKLDGVSVKVSEYREGVASAKKEVALVKGEIEETVSLVNQTLSAIENTVVGLTSQRIQGSSFTTPNPLTRSTYLTTEAVMINQAKFNAAVQLGNTPTMVFNGELIKYVQLLIVVHYSIYWKIIWPEVQKLLLSSVFFWIR